MLEKMRRWQRICPSRNYRNRLADGKSKCGFTMIELLISASIFAVISIAVYATFNSGMNVWRRAKEVNVDQRRVMLKIERIQRELRQTFAYGRIKFYAGKGVIYFPQIVDSEVFRVAYSYDADKKIIFKSMDRLADIIDKEEDELELKRETYLSGVEAMNFFFFYFDFQEGVYAWKDSWEEGQLPKAVKLDITTPDKTYAATIFIPSA